MHKLNLKWILLGMLFASMTVKAESASKQVKIDKGQVIDFLFLNRKADGHKYRKQYFSEVGKPARAMGYTPITSFRIKRNPIRGNYHPDALAIAGWKGDYQDRMGYLAQLMKKIPDLHARRFDIWSTFMMTHYYISEDMQLTFDPNKIYVLSAYWQRDKQSFDDFRTQHMAKIQQAGGQLKMRFGQGKSPFGYTYDPDLTLVTEWQNQDTFDEFHQQNLEINQTAVKQVNEFYLEVGSK